MEKDRSPLPSALATDLDACDEVDAITTTIKSNINLAPLEEFSILFQDVKKKGYLRKLKSDKLKYFVLRSNNQANPSDQTSAVLTYYEDIKTFQKWTDKGKPAKRTILLRTVFAIHPKFDDKGKHVIALYTKKKMFGIVVPEENYMNDWLEAIRDLWKEAMVASKIPAFKFDHIWQAKVSGHISKPNPHIFGLQRICLSANVLYFVRTDLEPQHLIPQMLSLSAVRRFGHHKSTFCIYTGRRSEFGEGKLWINTESGGMAKHMHQVIADALSFQTEDVSLRPSAVSPREQPALPSNDMTDDIITEPVQQTQPTSNGQELALPGLKKSAPSPYLTVDHVVERSLSIPGKKKQECSPNRVHKIRFRDKIIKIDKFPIVPAGTEADYVETNTEGAVTETEVMPELLPIKKENDEYLMMSPFESKTVDCSKSAPSCNSISALRFKRVPSLCPKNRSNKPNTNGSATQLKVTAEIHCNGLSPVASSSLRTLELPRSKSCSSRYLPMSPLDSKTSSTSINLISTNNHPISESRSHYSDSVSSKPNASFVANSNRSTEASSCSPSKLPRSRSCSCGYVPMSSDNSQTARSLTRNNSTPSSNSILKSKLAKVRSFYGNNGHFKQDTCSVANWNCSAKASVWPSPTMPQSRPCSSGYNSGSFLYPCAFSNTFMPIPADGCSPQAPHYTLRNCDCEQVSSICHFVPSVYICPGPRQRCSSLSPPNKTKRIATTNLASGDLKESVFMHSKACSAPSMTTTPNCDHLPRPHCMHQPTHFYVHFSDGTRLEVPFSPYPGCVLNANNNFSTNCDNQDEEEYTEMSPQIDELIQLGSSNPGPHGDDDVEEPPYVMTELGQSVPFSGCAKKNKRWFKKKFKFW